MSFSWLVDTTPFTDSTGTVPARFTLEQVDDNQFRLVDSFQYTTVDRQVIQVTPKGLGPTDLASIPRALAWFAGRTGRHTPAALVHDQLVSDGMTSRDRMAADREFRDAMDALDVPRVRSRVMWSAVAMATRMGMRPWGLAGIVAWVLAAISGIGTLVFGLATRDPLIVLGAVSAPMLAAGLWGRQYSAGVIGGYALWLVAIPTGAAFFAYYLVYWPIEQLVRFGRRALSPRGPSIPGPAAYRRV